MTNSIPKVDVIEAIADERIKWNNLVKEVSPARMEISGAAGDWTFKDVAAHLSFWHEELVNTLERVVDPSVEPYVPSWPEGISEPDGINEWAYQQCKDRRVSDVLEEADGIFARLGAVAERMPEETLNSPDIFEWQADEPLAQWIVDRRLFNHYYVEHQEPIRQWLDSTEP